MLKKTISIVLTAVMLAFLFAAGVFAGAINFAGGCKTGTTVKKAATGAVVHDGVISPGEYTEVAIDRDAETTDLLLSWDGGGDMLLKATDFLGNVHFYTSWDANGINLAAQATLLEDPYCAGTFPSVYYEYEGKSFPGDEFFMFQFGCIFKIEVPSEGVDGAVLYRAIGLNTETGEQLYGWYWDNGRTGSLSQTAGVDYFTRVDGRTVTYEMTLPFESVLEEEQISDSLPVEGSEFYFTISLTGGSKGNGHSGNETYAVSLGDGGYMTVARIISDFSGALGVISYETVTGEPDGTETGPVPGDRTPDDPTPTHADPADPVTAPADPDNPNPTPDPENPNPTPVTPARTGDPIIVIAAVAAVSAAGAFVIRKRRG